MDTEKYLLGFDIGGTKRTAILGHDLGPGQLPEIVAKELFQTRAFPGPGPALDELLDLATVLVAEHGVQREQILAGGIRCGGPLSSTVGLTLSPPNLPGWNRAPAVEWLGRALQNPCPPPERRQRGALAEWH